ncbi:hypothetical protein SSP531S_58650 [Streptomyces spongiicola]|uniref:Uncharacterized protein n=1 Tax=Streptomyces spongiicola TaxID=1690221 RepID=A0A388T7T1_9ACTN|nr:hypothetical protein [Streptomyces spongiicola]GBQ04371.1 hypothetical protein SSP531S_58650 [Streptomyces spongiicola]
MAILLLGHYDHGGNLVIEESLTFEDDDQKSMDAVVAEQDNEDGMAWACSFLVDRHSDAVQRAYEEYVNDAGGQLIDEAEGFEPANA